MVRIKLDFRNLSVPDKVIRAQQSVASLTGNPNFPTPNPPLATVTAAIDTLQTSIVDAHKARDASLVKTAAQHDNEAKLDQLMRQLAGYIESVSDGDEVKIRSAGVSIRSAATPSTDTVSTPANISLTEGDHEAELDMSWNSVKRARSYVIQHSADPPTDTSWTQIQVVTASSTTISGLTRGAKHWFRVAAVGSSGQSGWSDPAMKIAP